MIDTIKKMGAGSGGTRNIAGTTVEHVLLEQEIADLHNKDASLVFGSCCILLTITSSTHTSATITNFYHHQILQM